jgi:hypothetical protein
MTVKEEGVFHLDKPGDERSSSPNQTSMMKEFIWR